jgi:DNA invertase Pin-like site-specific DNA recombinase
MLTVLGGLAEFDRDLIRGRTTEGRERAKANAVKMGRPSKLTAHQKKEVIKRRDHGEETLAEIRQRPANYAERYLRTFARGSIIAVA